MASERREGQVVLGRYRLERFLGRGAFGEVWAARHEALERVDALKFANPDKHAQLGAEAKILARLKHPHIVQVYDVDLTAEQPTLVMDYIAGESLRQRMERELPLPVAEALAIAHAVLAALEHAHAAGILHRDVKPGNVLLGADGVVRLGDFGLGKLTGEQVSALSLRSMGSARSPEGSLLHSGEGREPAREAASVAGTLAYMAPEQKRGAEDARSDVFAVGVLLYEVLCCRRPELRFKDPSAHNAGVPAWLDDAILRALEPEPEDRFASARGMWEALGAMPAQRPTEVGRGVGRPVHAAPAEAARVVRESEPAPLPPPAPRVALPSGLSADLSRASVQLPSGSSWPVGAVVNEKDGSVLVLVSAGEAVFGSPKRMLMSAPSPQIRVALPAYYIGATEVTNAQYAAFLAAAEGPVPAHWKGGLPPPGLENHPAEHVLAWFAARYCEWAGLRLPRELEWEKAARGTDGRTYPWGNDWDKSRCRNKEDRVGRSAAVGSYPSGASPYGVLDMAGNVYDVCADSLELAAYGRYARGDLSLPKPGVHGRVVRGGSWGHDRAYCRCAYRVAQAGNCAGVGFRVARDSGP